MLSSQAGADLLRQLTTEVTALCPDIDQLQLRSRFAAILSLYDIKPINIDYNLDLMEKIDTFLSAKKLEGLSPLTLEGYELELRIFADKVRKPVNEITTQDIRLYLSMFPDIKLSTLSTKLSRIKSFFAWLTEEEIIDRDPARRIKPPKTEKRLPKALTIEELEMIREHCETYRERALIEVLYATGCRLSEVIGINKEDINWHEGTVNVIGKGDKERTVYLSFKAMYHLKKYLKSRTDDNPALFVTSKKPYNRLGARSIQREIKKIAARTDIKKMFIHTFLDIRLQH